MKAKLETTDPLPVEHNASVAMRSFYAVIIAGGRGERFWPLSTSASPKQLLRLFGGQSLLTQAVDRLDGLIPPERRYLITSDAIRKAVLEDAPNLPDANIIGEPCGRDTAAAIAVGCSLVRRLDPKATFCVLTADHVIRPAERFRADLRQCLEMAHAHDRLITLGIPPAFPSEGFGYLEARMNAEDDGFYPVARFVEKPDRRTAEDYLQAGNYYWNSGMFIWSAASLTRAFECHRPDLARLMDALDENTTPADLQRALSAHYADLKKISIDYAVMEKADNVWMKPAGFEWHDVGSWSAMADHFEVDSAGNTCVGSTATLDAAGNIVVSDPDHLVALLGVSDLVVVHAPQATLVCRRDQVQDVKRMVEHLKSRPDGGDYL